MAQTKGIVLFQSTTFADDYDVYVDYGKGRPIKMNYNEDVYRDVEYFLTGKNCILKSMNNNKINGYLAANMINMNNFINMNHGRYDLRKNTDEFLSSILARYMHYHRNLEDYMNDEANQKSLSAFIPNNNSYHNSSGGKNKVIYDETWFSNKQYNTRVAAFIDKLYETVNVKPTQVSNDYKQPYTYQIPKAKIEYKDFYSNMKQKPLSLNFAVNGLSKFSNGSFPLKNSNLTHGDFGDDAGMIIDNKNFSFVGLADGAGGNRSFGINPADFSRAILAACESIIHWSGLKPNQLPRLIKSAMEQVEARSIKGSSTLCLMALDKQERTLTSLNIGDSGFVIYRDNELYSQSICTMNPNSQVPKQLFSLHDSISISSYMDENDFLKQGSLQTVKVRPGDIIILSSDGLWNVMKPNQLKKIIARHQFSDLQKLADEILQQAINGYFVNGRDDILIIVCRIDES